MFLHIVNVKRDKKLHEALTFVSEFVCFKLLKFVNTRPNELT